MENQESQEQQDEAQNETTDTAETEKRYRRKSLRRQLQKVIDQLGKAAEDKQMKPAKKVDALLRQSEVLLRLQEMDKDEANQTLQDEHAAAIAQKEDDARRIAELDAQNAALKNHKCEIVTRVATDPEHLKIRAENATLSTAFRFLARVVSVKEQAAIRAIQQLSPDAASLVCEAVEIKEGEYREYLRTYATEQSLLSVIERAQVDDTPLLRFCRAALAVNHDLNLAPKKRRDIHSVQEELIERERQENADRQATMNVAWRSQMGLI